MISNELKVVNFVENVCLNFFMRVVPNDKKVTIYGQPGFATFGAYSPAILKSGEDLGISEWSAILENTQKSFERVSCVQGWLNER